MQGTAGSPCGLAEGREKAAVGVVRARELETWTQELQPTGWKRGTLPSEQEASHLTLRLGCWSRSPSPTGETPPAPWSAPTSAISWSSVFAALSCLAGLSAPLSPDFLVPVGVSVCHSSSS